MKDTIRISVLIGAVIFGFTFGRAAPPLDKISNNTVKTLLYGDDPRENAKTVLAFALEDQNGNALELKDLKGKVVFINFWATWCPPCIVEMPDINDLYNTVKDDDQIVFLMISLDQSFDKAKEFLDQKGFDFDIYKAVGSIPQEFQTQAIPTTFVLDKEGNIAKKYMGAQSYNTDEFKGFLEELKE